MRARILLLLVPFACAACAPAPLRHAAESTTALDAAAASATVTADGGPIIALRGEPLTATKFELTDFSQIPFGRWLNGIPLETVQHGTSFSADLQNCSTYGCVVNVADQLRVLVAKKGVAGAVRLDLYDHGWKRFGYSGIDDRGWVAVPMIGPQKEHEVWVIRDNGRMAGRIPHPVEDQPILRWRGRDLFLIHHPGDTFRVLQLSLEKGTAVSATPVEPWWYECVGGLRTGRAIGVTGDVPEFLSGWLSLPLHRRDDPVPGLLKITESARPMTSGGFANPVRVVVDCHGRFNVVSANGEEIWCLRYSPEGELLKASMLRGNLAGDAKTIQIDSTGTFSYLATEFDEDMKPALLHLGRLN